MTRLAVVAVPFGMILILCLTGCTLETSGTYSMAYHRNAKQYAKYTQGGYKPLVVDSVAKVKAGFEKLLIDDLCPRGDVPLQLPAFSPDNECKGTGKTPQTDIGCWTSYHYETKWCADNVTRYTIDQCAVLVGGENRFAANFDEVMLPLLSAMGLASDITAATAVAAKGNTAATAVIAAMIAGSGTVQKVIPPTTSAKASDMTSSENAHLLISHFYGRGAPCLSDSTSCQSNDLIYAGLHDALLSSCPALNP